MSQYILQHCLGIGNKNDILQAQSIRAAREKEITVLRYFIEHVTKEENAVECRFGHLVKDTVLCQLPSRIRDERGKLDKIILFGI